MKPNRFKQMRVEGKIPVGQMISEFGTRGIARMLDAAGADFALIDTEHGQHTTGEIADLVAWFAATTVAPFVRVPQIAYHLIARTMDAGALGVMVPNVRNADEARTIVDAVKYAPLGARGVGLGGPLTSYRGAPNAAEFLSYSNENTTVICQIESAEGMANLEAIATTPGVDVLWVGQSDLSQSLGIPGEFHDQRFLDSLKRVVDVCDAHNIGAGIQPAGIAQTQEWMEIGFNVISYGTEVSVYTAAMKQAMQQVRALAAK